MANEERKEDWMAYMRNPHAWTIKKYLYEVLQERFIPHEKFIDRMANWFETKQDLEDWGKLIADLYELGFLRAVEQYSEKMQAMGYKISITTEKSQDKGATIFHAETEKSG